MLSFVGTALFKLGIPGDLSQFWVAFEMETFDENRRHSDGIIQQTQKKKPHSLSQIPESQAKGAEMTTLSLMTRIRDVWGTSQELCNLKGQVELQLEKQNQINEWISLSQWQGMLF